MPLYESTPDVVKSEIATFFEVFPNGTIWGNLNNGEGYDVVLLGQTDGGPLDADGAQQRLLSPDHAAVLASLSEVGFKSLGDLLGTYAGHAADLGPWLQSAEINRDRTCGSRPRRSPVESVSGGSDLQRDPQLPALPRDSPDRVSRVARGAPTEIGR